MTVADSTLDVGNAMSALLGAAGPTGVVVYLTIRFFSHLAEKDKLDRDAQTALVARVEAIAADFKAGQAAIVGDFRAEHRQTVDQLIGISRESVAAMSSVSDRVGELGGTVGELKTEVRGLAGAVEHLNERVDGIDPPAKPRGRQ